MDEYQFLHTIMFFAIVVLTMLSERGIVARCRPLLLCLLLTFMKSKAPNPIDLHVGSRLRMRRTMLKMSQEKLGDRLGLTFQQIQKYEKGRNRVSASRLQQIADILEVPVSYFFEGRSKSSDGSREDEDLVTALLGTRQGVNLARAFLRVRSGKLRQSIVVLIEDMTEQ